MPALAPPWCERAGTGYADSGAASAITVTGLSHPGVAPPWCSRPQHPEPGGGYTKIHPHTVNDIVNHISKTACDLHKRSRSGLKRTPPVHPEPHGIAPRVAAKSAREMTRDCCHRPARDLHVDRCSYGSAVAGSDRSRLTTERRTSSARTWPSSATAGWRTGRSRRGPVSNGVAPLVVGLIMVAKR